LSCAKEWSVRKRCCARPTCVCWMSPWLAASKRNSTSRVCSGNCAGPAQRNIGKNFCARSRERDAFRTRRRVRAMTLRAIMSSNFWMSASTSGATEAMSGGPWGYADSNYCYSLMGGPTMPDPNGSTTVDSSSSDKPTSRQAWGKALLLHLAKRRSTCGSERSNDSSTRDVRLLE
jgi:hypothetical protein